MGTNTGSYEYKIQHRPGSKMCNADSLSRLPLMDQPRDCNIPILGDVHLLIQQVSDTIVTVNDIRKWTSKDTVLARVHHFILNGWLDTCPEDVLKPLTSIDGMSSVLWMAVYCGELVLSFP